MIKNFYSFLNESMRDFVGKAYSNDHGIITVMVGEYTKRNDALNFISYDMKAKRLVSAGILFDPADAGTETNLSKELKAEIKSAAERDSELGDESLFDGQEDILWDVQRF